MSVKTLLCILGPTAVGKTAAAIKVARRLQTEIISADSRQFYKEVSIGTAKPTPAELAEVPHHFIGQLNISDVYSAGDFERDALQKLGELFKHKDVVVAVGGSGLYVKALIDGLDVLPPANEQLRTALHELFAADGIEGLQQYLKQLNEEAYLQTEILNPQRIMRAIEIETAVQNGFVNYSNKQPRTFNTIKVVLDLPREVLYERINQRVDLMMQQGLLEEVRSVRSYQHTYAMQTVGYTEIFEYMEGKHTLEKAVELIKQHTRNFAKRQLTWFRKEAPKHWFAPTDIEQILALL
ncbi:MAG: tRNA (adenosine(37)-N6)-dimethylallyltransferase MiaA [Bacteroidota bacterium]